MANICCIKSCSSRRNNDNMIFYEFPEISKVRNQWIDVISKVPNDGAKLCNLHFKSSDYIRLTDGSLQLRNSAVPSRNLKIDWNNDREGFVCRACLSEGYIGFQSISEMNLDTYYTDLTRIDLLPDVHLPRMLCQQCNPQRSVLISRCFFAYASDSPVEFMIAVILSQEEEILTDHHVDDSDLAIKSENDETTTKMSIEISTEAAHVIRGKEKMVSTEKVKYKKMMRELGYIKCGQCEKTFTKLGTFYKHKRDHNTTSMCDLCGLQFSSSRALRTHHIFKHQDERKFKCDLCDFAFKVKSSLEGHMQSRHTKERNYVCDRCSATFKSKRSVQGHIRMIHSNKPLIFECDQCDKKFKTRTYLIVHKNSHTGQKMFSCPLCRTEFTTKKYRDIHMDKKRCQNKPFQCHVCLQIFKEKRNHRLHMRRFHPEIPESEAKAVPIANISPIEDCEKADS